MLLPFLGLPKFSYRPFWNLRVEAEVWTDKRVCIILYTVDQHQTQISPVKATDLCDYLLHIIHEKDVSLCGLILVGGDATLGAQARLHFTE